MPIKGLSDRRRLPRIGKIHLGIKVAGEKGTYPKGVDYFVVRADDTTPDWAAAAFHDVYGAEPRELEIIFPTDDTSQWADPWYRAYSKTQGLICSGDGEEARAKWDLGRDGLRPEGVPSGTWASGRSENWVYRTIPCLAQECPLQIPEPPVCKTTMNLLFLLPKVKGFGAWQIDTSSRHSIQNLLDNIELIKATLGRIRGLPLKLRLQPRQVSPKGIKTKTVFVLNLAVPDMSLEELLLQASKMPEHGLLLPPAVSEEEAPEDLFLPAVDTETGEIDEPVSEQLKNAGELLNRAWTELRISSATVFRVLGISRAEEIMDFSAAWQKLTEWIAKEDAAVRSDG